MFKMNVNKSLRILNPQTRFKEKKEILENTLEQVFPDNNKVIKVLEAGCGKKWVLRGSNRKFEITGIDISKEAIDYRLNTQKDLDHYIIGDLQDVSIENGSYDVVYSNFVLEHIQGSEYVLQSFTKWLKKGGIIIVQVPDRNSTAIFFSRFTPHFIHILYYKYIKGMRNAGEPGHGPFKAFYDRVLSIDGFRRFSENNGCKILAEVGILSPYKGFSFLSRIIQLLSFGKLSHKHNGLLYILQKKS
jgi:SAM-dependent methyltransferase